MGWGEGVLSDVITLYLFLLAAGCCAALCCSYAVLQVIRDTWLGFLEKRFPDLEFDRCQTLTGALDSPSNPGVIIVLLGVRGPCDVTSIRQRFLEEVVDKRSANGNFAHPRLRKTLTSRWGCYAWTRGAFSMENHVTLYGGTQGAFINECSSYIHHLNVQECCNDVIGWGLPPDVPPWHVTVIPSSVDSYYLLVRIHHLLLTTESRMRLGDFLPITVDRRELGSECRRLILGPGPRSHPLRNLHKPARALSSLVDELSQTFSNRWNEFLATYDPLENPASLKTPGLQHILAVIVICVYSTLKYSLRTRTFTQHEWQRRDVTPSLLLASLAHSFGPLCVTGRLLWIFKMVLVKLPILFLCEIWALTMVNDEHYADRSVIKGFLDGYHVIVQCYREVCYYWRLVYNAPRVLAHLFWSYQHPHYLQKLSRSGHKVVGWSHPVPVAVLDAVSEATGASRYDIALTATGAALRDLFLVQGRCAPAVLDATAQALSQGELLAGSPAGVICLTLPTGDIWPGDDVAELHSMQQAVLSAKLQQPALYLATALQTHYHVIAKCLPACIARLLASGLSRRLPISILDIFSPVSAIGDIVNPGYGPEASLWNQQIYSFMYWPIQQANTCLSVTLMTHGDSVTLGVMADSALSPHYNIMCATFPGHVRRLATAAGVTITSARRLPIPCEESDDVTPDSLSSGSDFSMDDDVPQPTNPV